MVRIESLVEGAPEEDGVTTPAGSDDSGNATRKEWNIVESLDAAGRIDRGATGGRKEATAEQGNLTSPINKGAGRLLG